MDPWWWNSLSPKCSQHFSCPVSRKESSTFSTRGENQVGSLPCSRKAGWTFGNGIYAQVPGASRGFLTLLRVWFTHQGCTGRVHTVRETGLWASCPHTSQRRQSQVWCPWHLCSAFQRERKAQTTQPWPVCQTRKIPSWPWQRSATSLRACDQKFTQLSTYTLAFYAPKHHCAEWAVKVWTMVKGAREGLPWSHHWGHLSGKNNAFFPLKSQWYPNAH